MSWGLLVLRSLLGRPRTALIALLAAGSAALLTVGAALVGTVYEGTRRSIIESGAGHLQLYHAQSSGPPTAIPGPGGGPELLPLSDFPAAEQLVRGVPGVKDVVPMELGGAEIFRGNYLDERLKALRTLVSEPPSAARQASLERMTAELRRVLREIARDGRQRDVLFTNGKDAQEEQRALDTAASDGFWERFGSEPLSVLEFIENRVSKQLGEGESLPVDLIGADVAQFARAFPRVEQVSGELPPPGTRGILLGQAFYEQSFKLPLALRLDDVARTRAAGGQIARDERLRTLLDRNAEELPYLLLTLDPERAEAVRAALSRLLGRQGALEPLFKDFLALDDGNFDARYRQFYAELAPKLRLYRLAPGDTLSLRPLNDSAGVRVRVYGTFRFRGLGSDQDRVNSVCLIDPISAQLLAHRQTRAQAEEVKALVTTLDLPQVPSTAELEKLEKLELGPAAVVEAKAPAAGAPEAAIRFNGPAETFSPSDVAANGVLQAAVILEPGVSPEQVAGEISARAGAHKLPLATAGWSEVGGMVSQLAHLSWMVLLLASIVLGLIVVLVSAGALVLMANERVGEVGTMRAIGMQRGQVMFLMLLEGLVLGGLGAAFGAGAAALLLKVGTGHGIAVTDGTMQFFLGGPLFVPALDAGRLVQVAVGVTVEVVLASLWPAWSGSKVSPRVAMSRGNDG